MEEGRSARQSCCSVFGGALAGWRRRFPGTLFRRASLFLWVFCCLVSDVTLGFYRLLDFIDYPISHSLLMATVWAVAFAGTYYAPRRNVWNAAVVGAPELSHWVLDFIVDRPGLQLYPGGEGRVGLGLWNSWAASITVEALFFGVGLAIYIGCTRARDSIGRYGFWELIAFLFFGWVSTLFAGAPPNVNALTRGGIAMGLTAP